MRVRGGRTERGAGGLTDVKHLTERLLGRCFYTEYCGPCLFLSLQDVSIHIPYV